MQTILFSTPKVGQSFQGQADFQKLYRQSLLIKFSEIDFQGFYSEPIISTLEVSQFLSRVSLIMFVKFVNLNYLNPSFQIQNFRDRDISEFDGSTSAIPHDTYRHTQSVALKISKRWGPNCDKKCCI